MRLKVNFNNKSKIISFDDDDTKTFGDLITNIISSFNNKDLEALINTNSAKLLIGNRTNNIDLLECLDASLKSLHIKNLTQIWIEDPTKPSVKPTISSTPQKPNNSTALKTVTKRHEGIHTLESINKKQKLNSSSSQIKKKESIYSAKIDDIGYGVVRKMDDDNSCLFHAISYCLLGDANQDFKLRNDVADVIREDPEQYNEGILGKKPHDYISWIQQPDKWGGAIEILILANKYQITIKSVDLLTGRIDNFEPSDKEVNPNKNFVVLLYNGVHYDSLALSTNPESKLGETWADQTQFQEDTALGKSILSAAKKLSADMKNDGYAIDLAGFKGKCKQCGQPIIGEQGVVDHMKQTNHTDFAQTQ